LALVIGEAAVNLTLHGMVAGVRHARTMVVKRAAAAAELCTGQRARA
jgi:hypothetical protein